MDSRKLATEGLFIGTRSMFFDTLAHTPAGWGVEFERDAPRCGACGERIGVWSAGIPWAPRDYPQGPPRDRTARDASVIAVLRAWADRDRA